MSIAAYGRVPYLSEPVLRQHHVYEPADGRFRSAARTQQALYRERNGWSIGSYPAEGERCREIGNYLSEEHDDCNFISPEVARLARLEVAYREDDALIDEARLFRNMLSSHPATFNFFGPLKIDLKLASAVAKRLFPDFVQKVTGILFEHSPSRRDERFIDDRSAYDVLLKVKTTTGQHGFVAIEFKFTETMTEQPARLRPRYDQVSQSSGLFKDPGSAALRTSPLQQLWRLHMLSATMLQNALYSEGRFAVFAPSHNSHVFDAVSLYRQHLKDDGPVSFDAIPLESMVKAIQRAGARDLAATLNERYLDFSPLEELI
jgi:hypothetical protein